MKPGSNYKMSKQSKRMLSTIVDKHSRADFKRATILADLSADRVFKPNKQNKEKSGE